MENGVSTTLSSFGDFFIDFGNCILFGKCKEYDYEYVMYLNGENIKVDYCFSSRLGNSYCELNEQTYSNVQYTSNLLSESEVKGDIYLFHPLILTFVILPIFVIYIFKVFVR